MKTAKRGHKPKVRLSPLPELSETSKQCLRTAAELFRAIPDHSGPAHYRIEIEFYSDEAEKAYVERWYELQLAAMKEPK